jgi:predicted amidohydrolase
VRIAGIVLKWVRADREVNFRRLERHVLEAAATGAKIVCTADCFLDGYAAASPGISRADYRALAEAIPTGAYCRRLAVLAAKAKVYLVAGMIEIDGVSCYDAAVFLGPDGELIGKSRKQLLGRADTHNTPGDSAPVFDTPYGCVGILIDGDCTDPAIVRRSYAKGAQILFCPSGVWGSIDNILKVQARSRENKLFIVSVHPTAFLATGPEGVTHKRETFKGVMPCLSRRSSTSRPKTTTGRSSDSEHFIWLLPSTVATDFQASKPSRYSLACRPRCRYTEGARPGCSRLCEPQREGPDHALDRPQPAVRHSGIADGLCQP